MKGIVLDTHAFIWAADGETHRFSVATQQQLQAVTGTNRLYLSAISLWEVAMLIAKQRIGLGISPEEWLDQALRFSGAQILPIDTAIAGLSVRLSVHGDPADRLIVATALTHGHTLCTQDDKILAYAALHPELKILPLRGAPE